MSWAEIHEAERAEESGKLEIKAVAMWKQYKIFLPGSAKKFFNELAEFLGWETLKKETK